MGENTISDSYYSAVCTGFSKISTLSVECINTKAVNAHPREGSVTFGDSTRREARHPICFTRWKYRMWGRNGMSYEDTNNEFTRFIQTITTITVISTIELVKEDEHNVYQLKTPNTSTIEQLSIDNRCET